MLGYQRGWKLRQAQARKRQEGLKDRLAINAIRQAHYMGLKESQVVKEAEAETEVEVPKEEVAEEAEEAKSPEKSPEDMNNADLREALARKGFEVPKTTARTRLIELYNEHVV